MLLLSYPIAHGHNRKVGKTKENLENKVRAQVRKIYTGFLRGFFVSWQKSKMVINIKVMVTMCHWIWIQRTRSTSVKLAGHSNSSYFFYEIF